MTAGPYSIGSTKWPGLSKLIEECGEVLQIAGKLIGTDGATEHWDGKGDLGERLESELGDLLAAIYFVRDHCGLSGNTITNRQIEKEHLFKKWHAEQDDADYHKSRITDIIPYPTNEGQYTIIRESLGDEEITRRLEWWAECDGSATCRATEHIFGCFSGPREP